LLDHLDQLLQTRFGDSLPCDLSELRRSLDAQDPAAERLGEDHRRALSACDVDETALRTEAEELAETADLSGLVGFWTTWSRSATAKNHGKVARSYAGKRVEPAGLEPATFWMPSRRSPN